MGYVFNNSVSALLLGLYSGYQYSNSYFGNGVGTYILNAGSLGGSYELLGEGGTAIFTQTGGTNNCQAHFWLGGAQTTALSSWYPQADNGSGYATGGTSTYTLSGGILLGPGRPQGGSGFLPYGELIGDGAFATFIQTGGTNITPKISMGGHYQTNGRGGSKNCTGTYDLEGGLLQVDSIGNNFVPGYSTFNFTGGTIQAYVNPNDASLAGFANGPPLILGTASTTVATIDANGQTATPHDITGAGELRIIDSAGGGVVVLNSTSGNSYTYAGGTVVLSGTLELIGNQALPTIGVLTVAGPGSIVSSVRAGTLFEKHRARADGRRRGGGYRKLQSRDNRLRHASNYVCDGRGHGSLGKRSGAGPRAWHTGLVKCWFDESAYACLAAAESRLTTGDDSAWDGSTFVISFSEV